MKPVTEKDVARLLEGEIADQAEIDRVWEAIDNDPHLNKVYELFSPENDGSEVVDGLKEFDLPDLSQTRLGRLTSGPNSADLNNQRDIETKLCLPGEDGLQEIDLKLTRQGDTVVLQADFPEGQHPIGLVLAQFDFGEHREVFHVEITLPDLRPQRNRDQQDSDRNMFRLEDRFAPVSGAAMADDEGDAADDKEDTSSPFSAVQNLNGKHLTVTAVVPEECDEEIIAAEVEYQSLNRGLQTITHLATLERIPGSPLADCTIENFPWPDDFLTRKAALSVRPLTNSDLPLLTSRQVTQLMAHQRQFAAVPLSLNSAGRWTGELRYEFQQDAAVDPRTTWFVRMSVEGGAV